MPTTPDLRRRLALLDEDVDRRCASTRSENDDWPCREGCADCCRSLASVPEMTAPEWERLADAIARLDDGARNAVELAIAERRRLADTRPIVCPLLDGATGLCRVYQARPLACRTYGYYADRDGVLGCQRIAAMAEREVPVVWGNHESMLASQAALGAKRSLLDWVSEGAPTSYAR